MSVTENGSHKADGLARDQTWGRKEPHSMEKPLSKLMPWANLPGEWPKPDTELQSTTPFIPGTG